MASYKHNSHEADDDDDDFEYEYECEYEVYEEKEEEEDDEFNKKVTLSPLGMCRICLCDKAPSYIDVIKTPTEPNLVQYVSQYYQVDIIGGDNKSTKLCQCCLEYIDIWRGHVEKAKASQIIVDYLAQKVVNKRKIISNKRKVTTSRRIKKKIKLSSITEHEVPPPSTSNDMIELPLKSIQQHPSQNIQYVSVFPSTFNSKEIMPFASTSTEVIPYVSTSTKNIPIASNSTEIIPSASTSTEIIPIASTSTKIIPSFTIDDVSSTGDKPIWYSMANETVDHEPQPIIFARSESFKVECVCIFCIYQYEEVSRNVYKHISFCSKHSKPYACLIENCHCVFPNKEIFFQHYRTHLKLKSTTYLCRQCFAVLTCARRSVPLDHTHQDVSKLLKCCKLTFTTLAKLVIHKLMNHTAMVITSNNRSHTLQKPNLTISKTELDDVKVGLDSPGDKSISPVIKDKGSFRCYCSKYFSTISDFIHHTQFDHKSSISLKEKGIQLCPLCDDSYLNEQFSEHIEKCTDSLKIGDKSLNHYGCVHCSFIFTNLSAREMRNHVLYCKSFKLGTVGHKLYHKCNNCTFISPDDNLSLEHANSNCIYFQLKMRYESGPDEKQKVLDRVEFIKEITQRNKNCTNDDDLTSSKTVCNTARQRLLKCYKYFCNNCKNLFFDKTFFFKHMTETGSYCRLQTSVYCQKCLTEFSSVEEYQRHLPSMPESSPIAIKQEPVEQNLDEDCNSIIDETPAYQNNSDVKLFEINDGKFFQKQEPLDFDGPSNIEYQEQELEHQLEPHHEQQQQNHEYEQQQDHEYEQQHDHEYAQQHDHEYAQQQEHEQEVSNDDNTLCQENELSTNDIYMDCEVEEKPDLNQLLGNVE